MHESVVGAYVSFAIAAGLLVVTPGLDTALVLRTVAAAGIKRAAFVALGTCCGVMIWGGVVAAGLGALLKASQEAYTVLRWTGAVYLTYIGARMLFKPRRAFVVVAPRGFDDAEVQVSNGMLESFCRGLLTNVLNPKIGVFYVTFLPQFVPSTVHAPDFILSLAAIQALEGAAWFSLLLALTRPIRQWLSTPTVVTALDRSTGLVLIGFGGRLAIGD